MRILAIDPGPEQSAYISWQHGTFAWMSIEPNDYVASLIEDATNEDHDILAIEGIASYGMAVGKDIFNTCIWIGRFIQAYRDDYQLIYRRDIKLHLCNSARAKDANIRQALLDRFPKTGGGKTPQVGTKQQPGPLYGIKTHLWSALAVAVVCEELSGKEIVL